MATSESQQKKRRNARPVPAVAIEQLIFEKIEARAAQYGAVATEKHFAGYFSELGIRVEIPAGSSPRSVLELRNALLETMVLLTTSVEVPFKWIIGIYSDDQLVSVVDPSSNPNLICPNCETEQSAVAEACLVCGEALTKDSPAGA